MPYPGPDLYPGPDIFPGDYEFAPITHILRTGVPRPSGQVGGTDTTSWSLPWNDGAVILYVTNVGVDPAILVVGTQLEIDELEVADRYLTVPGNSAKWFGPWPRYAYNFANDSFGFAFSNNNLRAEAYHLGEPW